MCVSVFHIHNKKTQPFFTPNKAHINTHEPISNILVDHTPSLVATLNDSNHIIKFVKARSWHEYIKLLWNHSRITKEIKGTRILKKLGLNVPQIYEVGYGIIPSLKHEYLGYYIMENLNLSKYQELSKLIKEGVISGNIREKIMAKVFEGLKLMKKNRVVFSDFHLDNIFADESGNITWIDAGVTKYNKINEEKFKDKFNQSITRFIFYCNDRGNNLSIKETDMFNTLLVK